MDVIDEINGLLEEIEADFQEIQSAVGGVLSSIPGWMSWVRDQVTEAWDGLAAKVNEFWTYLDELVDETFGQPDVISSVADAWGEMVGKPVSSQVGVIDDGNLMVDDNWAGSAADAYKQRVDLQKAAATSIKSNLTLWMANILTTVHGALTEFLTTVLTALTILAGALLVALGSLVTGPGVLVGVIAITAGITTCVGTIGYACMALNGDFAEARTLLTNNVLGESTGFPNDKWPSGATA